MDAGSMLDALRLEVSNLVETHCTDKSLAGLVLRALARPGMALHPEARCRAGVFTMEIYKSITGCLNTSAVHGAASIELLMESSFMFDHVADDEVVSSYGLCPTEELTGAIAVMNYSIAGAMEAAWQATDSSHQLQVMQQLFRNCISACAGQLRDHSFEARQQVTAEEAVEMTLLKAGSLGKLTASFAAGLATNNSIVVAKFGEFGCNVFTHLQLMDDLADACPQDAVSQDLLKGKKTLPLVILYKNLLKSETEEGNPESLTRALAISQDFRRLFETSHAKRSCAIVAEVFLNRARANLQDLADSGVEVRLLERFVESLSLDLAQLF